MIQIVGDGLSPTCVARAVSTIRCLLGYESPLPEGFPAPNYKGIFNTEIIAGVKGWFPRHRVEYWCVDKLLGEDREGHLGTTWNVARNFTEDWIVFFNYRTNAKSGSHCVIGIPTLYGRMKTDWVIRVSIAEKRDGNS